MRSQISGRRVIGKALSKSAEGGITEEAYLTLIMIPRMLEGE
jgi:hypothetical protein